MDEKEGFLVMTRLCFALLLLISSPLLLANTSPLKDFNHPRLIETTELAGILHHPGVHIVDMRTSVQDYIKGHIPNSVYLHFETSGS